jgi:hypothetical protein
VDPSPESLDALLEALEVNTHITNLGWTFGRIAMEDQARRFLDRNFDLLRQKRYIHLYLVLLIKRACDTTNLT